MKLFLDTGNIAEIEKWITTGLIDGITTNPTHLSKQQEPPLEIIKKICALLPNGEISVEVTEKEPQNVLQQAERIAAIANNVVVKIPCEQKYFHVIRQLSQKGVRINVTLVFTLVQAVMMAKIGAYYVSPFVGRWDDIDVDGTTLLYELRQVFDRYGFSTAILAASMRHVRHVHEALRAGADIITVPEGVMHKMTHHLVTQDGVKKFDDDWQKLNISQFP